jgi:hypothetical protein
MIPSKSKRESIRQVSARSAVRLHGRQLHPADRLPRYGFGIRSRARGPQQDADLVYVLRPQYSKLCLWHDFARV